MSGAEAAFVVGVVSEATSDREIARGLAERVLIESVDWLEAQSLAGVCRWRGFEEGTPFLSWMAIETSAKRHGIVAHGRQRGAFDERRARLALLVFNALGRRPDAVVLVRDTDNVADRVPSLERARSGFPWPFDVVLATPHTKRECWILNGFEPRGAEEQAALERLCRELGFDPCVNAERLTAKGKKGKKNAKAVLHQGLGVQPGSERERICWRETALHILRERGRETLLAAYLDEVAGCLVPMLEPLRHPRQRD